MASKTREKLIEVARQLFAHKGVAQTTMNDIASASAKGRRTIYTYFKNKKEIYNAVLEQESERMVDSLRDIVSLPLPVDERMRLFLHRRLENYETPSASASFKAWISFDSRRLARIRRLVSEKERVMLLSLVNEGVEQGVFRADRCELLTKFIGIAGQAVDPNNVEPDAREERAAAFDAFVTFIVTDIMA